MLAPIALYPDPLLAQILPAATFPDQIDAAQACLQGRVNPALIDNQPWDVSVKSVAHYPDVLAMLHNDKDWAVAVGQAYSCQQQAVFASTQRLRVRAYQVGNLVTTPQQRVVVTNDGTILIVPAQAQQIYVPVYHPQEVYVARQPDHTEALIAFTVGLLIGSWLDRDVDWHNHCVYYHGWRGGGWIANSRRHVHFLPVYVNPRFGRTVVANRDILRRPIPAFRSTVGRQAALHRVVYQEGRRPAGGFGSRTYGGVHHASTSPPGLRKKTGLHTHGTGTGAHRVIPTPGSAKTNGHAAANPGSGGHRLVPTPGSANKSGNATPDQGTGGHRLLPIPKTGNHGSLFGPSAGAEKSPPGKGGTGRMGHAKQEGSKSSGRGNSQKGKHSDKHSSDK